MDPIEHPRFSWGWFKSADLGWQLCLSIGANLLIGFLLLMITRCQDYGNAADLRLEKTSSELLQLASDVVMELHPPGEGAGREPDADKVFEAIKKFEALYWGRLNLIPLGESSRCLTDLHTAFVYAVEGSPSSRDKHQALQQLQLQLAIVGYAIREARNGWTSAIFGGDREFGRLAAACGRR